MNRGSEQGYDQSDDPEVDAEVENQPEGAMDAAEDEAQPWDPPVDPPTLPRGREGVSIAGSLGGLEDEEDDSPQHTLTDDEITARVRRLLRTDSATSMLRIHVSSEDGVVTLRGLVQTLEDTDNAAEVASRAPGVVDVVDELDVEA